jgi:hypothetical protein
MVELLDHGIEEADAVGKAQRVRGAQVLVPPLFRLG